MNDAVKYIKKCLKMGFAEDAINQQLKEAGWEEEVIQTAWEEARRSFSQKLLGTLLVLRGKGKIIASAAVAIIILVGGYLAYANFFAGRPDRIWSKAYENTAKAKSWTSRGEINYTDKSATAEEFTLTVTNAGEYHLDGRTLPDFVLESETKIKGQGLNIGLSVQSRKVGDVLFYKLDNSPFLSLFLGSNTSDESAKPQWFKINLDKKIEGQFSVLEFMQAFQNNGLKEFQKPFWQLKFLKLVKRLESGKIGEVPVWHYEAEISKEELKNYISALTRALGSEKQFEELNQNISGILGSLLNKLDFKKVEIWIGKKDKRVYRVLLETSAPSFANAGQARLPTAADGDYRGFIEALPFTASLRVENNFSKFDEPVTIEEPKGAVDYFEYLEKAAKTSLNAKAIADVRQLMTTLELYFNDQKRYPQRLGHLNVGGGGQVEYIGTLPKPLADPICAGINEYFNYAPSADGKSYTFDFCLTTQTETLSAGRHQASPQGIR